MGVSEGEYEHPRWNFTTPTAYVLLYIYSIEPSWGLRESNPEVIADPI